jgi:hypothetical protein
MRQNAKSRYEQQYNAVQGEAIDTVEGAGILCTSLSFSHYKTARAAVILSTTSFFAPLTGIPSAVHISFRAGTVSAFSCAGRVDRR